MPLTIHESARAFILGDATLAAKVGPNAVYNMAIPKDPPNCLAVVKIVSLASFRRLAGATAQCRMRLEVTFWAKVSRDAETAANRMLAIVAELNGQFGTGGVTFAVDSTLGPRGMVHDLTGFYGFQIDILGIVDMNTAAQS